MPSGSIRVGCYGCGMGACDAVSAGGKHTGTATYERPSRRLQCNPIHSCDRLPVACVTAMFPVIDDGWQYHFYKWRDSGVWDDLIAVLRPVARCEAGSGSGDDGGRD